MPVVTALCSTRNEQLAPPSFRRLTAVDSQPAPLVSADEAHTLYLWARFEEGSDLDVVTDVTAGRDVPIPDDGTTAVPLVDGRVLRYGTAKATARCRKSANIPKYRQVEFPCVQDILVWYIRKATHSITSHSASRRRITSASSIELPNQWYHSVDAMHVQMQVAKHVKPTDPIQDAGSGCLQ